MTRSRSRNLVALDLLRFGCALIVLAFHWGNGFVYLPPPGGRALLERMPLDAGWSPWVNSGWIGVELFFLLSGFVIAWSAEASSAASFAARRFLRLVPTAWLCATLTAAALLVARTLPADAIIGQWLASVLFWPLIRPIDLSYWTLAIEVNFYLLVGVSLLGGSSLGRIERVGMVLGLASAVYWIASCFVEVPSEHGRLFQLTLLPHGCFFALGVLIRTGQRSGPRLLPLACSIPIGAAALIEIEKHRIDITGNHPSYLSPLLLFLLCLLPILFAERLQPWLARHVSASVATMIGLMTYPLYLLHQELGALLIGGMLHLAVPFWLAAAVAFVLILTLSWATVRFGEPPLRAVLKRLGSERDQRPAVLGEAVL
jgi:peptidoglycan/LPS O-acetylase OafA/YrhL